MIVTKKQDIERTYAQLTYVGLDRFIFIYDASNLKLIYGV